MKFGWMLDIECWVLDIHPLDMGATQFVKRLEQMANQIISRNPAMGNLMGR